MRYYCYWKNSQYQNFYFPSIKLALFKSYHLRICNRILLWLGKLLQWNGSVNRTISESGLRSQGWPQWNCHVDGTHFQSGLIFQTGLFSLRVCCSFVFFLNNQVAHINCDDSQGFGFAFFWFCIDSKLLLSLVHATRFLL